MVTNETNQLSLVSRFEVVAKFRAGGGKQANDHAATHLAANLT